MQRTKLFQFFATSAAVLTSLVFAASVAHADRLKVENLSANQTLNLRSQPGGSGQLLGQIPSTAGNVRWNCQRRRANGVKWLHVTHRGVSGWANGAYLTQHPRSDRSCAGNNNNSVSIVQPAPTPPPAPNPNNGRELTCRGIDNQNINVRLFPNRAAIKLGQNAQRKRFARVAQARAGAKRIIILERNRFLLTTRGDDFLFIKRQNGNSALHRLNCQ